MWGIYPEPYSVVPIVFDMIIVRANRRFGRKPTMCFMIHTADTI